MFKPFTLISISLCLAALLAGLYLGGAFFLFDPPPETAHATFLPDNTQPLNTFSLTDQHNNPFSNADLNGRWSMLFFGFTYCPDICPLTLNTLQQTVEMLADRVPAEDLRVVLVSVDPARDSAARLKEYIDYFNPDFTAVTGPDAQLKNLTGSLGAYYSIPEQNVENYIVNHSAGIFLLSPEGHLKALFSAPHDPAIIAEDFTKIYNYFN